MSIPPNQPDKPHRPLSEISHLFLSSVRNQHTGGKPLPQRTPPGQQPAQQPAQTPPQVRRDVSMDLTPEEFAQVFGGVAPGDDHASSEHQVPAIALIGGHLNGKQIAHVHSVARHIAADRTRVGLIEIDAAEFRVTCLDGHGHVIEPIEAPRPAPMDRRKMSEALEELSWDVEQWLICLPNPRTPEARDILRLVPHWALLTTCDHDGVVSAYRMLKGLADLGRPRLSLALLETSGEEQVQRTFRKLSSVCGQFLQWPLDPEPMNVAAEPAASVSEHLVLCCRATGEGDAHGTQWQVMNTFLTSGPSHDGASPDHEAQVDSRDEQFPPSVQEHVEMFEPVVSAEEVRQIARPLTSDHVEQQEPVSRGASVARVEETTSHAPASAKPQAAAPAAPAPQGSAPEVSHMRLTPQADDDVIELVGDGADEATILVSIMRHGAGQLVECPVRPPMCPKAMLAVDRDRRLVLLAVAQQGLGDMRAIGQAYQWLMQNRALIAMAVPQLAIDAGKPPHLGLYVDQRDATADLLQPMLQNDRVTLQTYRRLRWGGRTGLLLNAA